MRSSAPCSSSPAIRRRAGMPAGRHRRSAPLRRSLEAAGTGPDDSSLAPAWSHCGRDARRVFADTRQRLRLLGRCPEFSRQSPLPGPPCRPEPAASATQRRDVLSGLFYVLPLFCYVKAATTPPPGPATRLPPRWYGLSLACFAAGLLSKSIVVTLPVTLLVLDVYPLRRLGGAAGCRASRPWLEKLPFFALSAVATIVAFLALLPLGNTRSLAHLGIGARLFLS